MPSLRLPSVALIAVLVVAACGGAAAPSGSTGGSGEGRPTPSTPGAAGSAPSVSEAPASAVPTPASSDEPGPSEDAASSDEPAPSVAATDAVTGGADACSGSDANREFFDGIARVVDWPVLCAVLPRGWFVAQGSYRLANGGKLVISYKGPAGASLSLSEGAFCAAADGCIPDGDDLGATALGPLDGTLYETKDGFAVIAAPGENPSWLLAAKGLDRATTTTLAAALAEVGR